jgi:ribose/xylose/arabinose/galactoside ABC-type transport system permease subunit
MLCVRTWDAMSTMDEKFAEPAWLTRPALSMLRLRSGDLSRLGMLVGLIIAGLVLTPSFLSMANIQVILLAVAGIGIMAYGMTLVVISGEIDLSIAGIAILSCIAGGLLIPTGSATLIIGVTLATGLALGLFNGVLTAALGIPSLIATLGMLGISRAVANIASGGQALYPDTIPAYLWLGRGDVAGIPVPVILLMVLGACALVLTRYAVFGRALYATGGNTRAALLSGIDVRKVRIVVFAISGVCAALAGMLESARLSYIDPAGFEGVELRVLAVTVLGGAALAGGSGSVIGTLTAALIIGIANNLLNQLGVSLYVQQVVTAIVILAVVLPGIRQRGIAK